MGERLVVSNPPFVEEDRHGILYCNGIDILKGIFNGSHYQPKTTTLEFILARVVAFDANMLCDPILVT